MAFKKITLEEWKALGLPVETTFIHFDNIKFIKKKIQKERKIKNQKDKNKK